MATNDFTLEVTLKQHTPIIHFQHEQEGATLRATEVKPKLDRFLIEKKGGWEHISNDWKVGGGMEGQRALRYKLSFQTLSSNPEPKEVEIIPPDKRKTLKASSIKLFIFSFNKEIVKLIRQSIDEFFSVHNFGLRQNKGWGGFIPDNIQNTDQYEGLMVSSGYTIYKYDGMVNSGDFYFPLMRNIWQVLKSGQNHKEYKKSLLFKYAANKGIRWEKRAIKKALFAKIESGELPMDLISNNDPVDVLKGEKGCETNTKAYFSWINNPEFSYDYRFIRLLLGMPEHYEYRAYGNYIYQVKPKSLNGIERFKAPITFKVFQRNLYAIVEKEPFPKGLLKESNEFSFSVQKKVNNNKDGNEIDLDLNLKLPSSFDLTEFLDEYFKCVGFSKLTKHG